MREHGRTHRRQGRKGLSRATLAIHQPPTDLGGSMGGMIGEVNFQFNPSQVQLGRSANWNTTPAVAYNRGAPPKFTGAEPASLQLEVFLDASGTPTSNNVQNQVEPLLSCCEVTSQSIEREGAVAAVGGVQLGFVLDGPVHRVRHQRQRQLHPVQPQRHPAARHLHPRADRDPQRHQAAEPDVGRAVRAPGAPPVAGDTLDSLAWREYGDATEWRVIAEANEIDDPMRLRPGTELLLPASSEGTA